MFVLLVGTLDVAFMSSPIKGAARGIPLWISVCWMVDVINEGIFLISCACHWPVVRGLKAADFIIPDTGLVLAGVARRVAERIGAYGTHLSKLLRY